MIAAAVTLVAIALAAVILTHDQAGEMMRRAHELVKNGDIVAGADLFGQIALMEPDSPSAPEAWSEMGFSYYVIGMPNAKVEDKGLMRAMGKYAFSNLIERYPQSRFVVDAHLYLAEILMSEGDTAGALEHYEAIVNRITDEDIRQGVLSSLAEGYERAGRYDLAVLQLEEIVRSGRKGRYFEEAHLRLARYWNERGEFERCVDQLRELLETEVTFETRQNALVRIVESLIQLQSFDEAREALQQVAVMPSNKALVDDLTDRIRRWSMSDGS